MKPDINGLSAVFDEFVISCWLGNWVREAIRLRRTNPAGIRHFHFIAVRIGNLNQFRVEWLFCDENRLDLGRGHRRPNARLLAESGRFRADTGRARAPLRRGGYVIDFWGLGYDIAERMGLIRRSIASATKRGKCGSWTIAAGASRVLGPGLHRTDGRALRHTCTERTLAFAVREAQGHCGSHFRRRDCFS